MRVLGLRLLSYLGSTTHLTWQEVLDYVPSKWELPNVKSPCVHEEVLRTSWVEQLSDSSNAFPRASAFQRSRGFSTLWLDFGNSSYEQFFGGRGIS